MPTFDMGMFLKDNGMQLMGTDDKGAPLVVGADGKQGSLDVDAVLKDNGVTRDQVSVEFNTPNTAIPYSPLSAKERMQWSFGDKDPETFKKVFAEKKFEDVKTDPEAGFVVKKGNIWQQVDPSFFGKADPWEIAKNLGKVAISGAPITRQFYDPTGEKGKEALDKLPNQFLEAGKGAVASLTRPGAGAEIGKDLADLAPDAIKMTGQTIGAAYGGIPGAGIGGAVASKVVTSLGRVIGTYQADAKTELGENLLEGVMSMAGQAVAAGTRPTVRDFDNTMSEVSKSATDGVKDRLASLFSLTKQTDESALRFVMHNTDDYTAMKSEIKAQVGTAAKDIYAQSQRIKFQAAEDLIKGASSKLSADFGANLETLFQAAESKGVKVDMEQALVPALKSIEDMGFGVFDRSGKDVVFKMYDAKARNILEKQGITNIQVLDDELRAPVMKMVNSVLDRAQLGEIKGRPAAQIIRNIEREVNQVTSSNVSQGAKDALDTIMLKMSSAVKEGTGSIFDKAGLNAEYTNLMSSYSSQKNAVNFGQKLLRQDNGPAALANALIQDSGKKIRAEGFAKQLVSLTGEKGEELFNKMQAAHSVGELAPWFKGNLISAAGASGAAAFAVSGKASLGTTAAVGAQLMSPRFQSLEVIGTRKLLQTLSYLPSQAKKAILQNDAAFDAFTRPIIESGIKASLGTQQLLEQSGAIPPQGGNRGQ